MKFQDILQQYKIPYIDGNGKHHHARAGWIQFDCPFCGRNTGKYHMGYSQQFHYVNCWRCGKKSVADAVIALLNINYSSAQALLKDIIPDVIARKQAEIHTLRTPKGIRPLLRIHQRYLEKRGFDCAELVRLWDIQSIGIGGGSQTGKIYIPITYHGQTVSWLTRSIQEEGSRYFHAPKTCESMNKKDVLYGEEYCRHAIAVTEGVTDAWKIGPGATATLGMDFSQSQILRISAYPLRVICFDNEPVAQQQATRLADLLSLYPGDTYNVVLDSKDPGAASTAEIKKIRKLMK